MGSDLCVKGRIIVRRNGQPILGIDHITRASLTVNTKYSVKKMQEGNVPCSMRILGIGTIPFVMATQSLMQMDYGTARVVLIVLVNKGLIKIKVLKYL